MYGQIYSKFSLEMSEIKCMEKVVDFFELCIGDAPEKEEHSYISLQLNVNMTVYPQ